MVAVGPLNAVILLWDQAVTLSFNKKTYDVLDVHRESREDI